MKYGMTGYGLYWHCVELIAGGVDRHNITFELEHDAEIIASETGINYELVQEMMEFMVGQGLFESNDGTITCMKLAKRLDQSMTSNPELRNIISKLNESGKLDSPKSHDSVMIESGQIRLDEIRREESNNAPKRKTQIPQNFNVSDRVKKWAKEKGYSRLNEHLEHFKLKAESKGYKYMNWDTALMTAIREDWAKINIPETDDYNHWRRVGADKNIHPGSSESHKDYIKRVKESVNVD